MLPRVDKKMGKNFVTTTILVLLGRISCRRKLRDSRFHQRAKGNKKQRVDAKCGILLSTRRFVRENRPACLSPCCSNAPIKWLPAFLLTLLLHAAVFFTPGFISPDSLLFSANRMHYSMLRFTLRKFCEALHAERCVGVLNWSIWSCITNVSCSTSFKAGSITNDVQYSRFYSLNME